LFLSLLPSVRTGLRKSALAKNFFAEFCFKSTKNGYINICASEKHTYAVVLIGQTHIFVEFAVVIFQHSQPGYAASRNREFRMHSTKE
jgi:hypothetical protein